MRVLVSTVLASLLLFTPLFAASHLTTNGGIPTADCGTVVGTDTSGKITVTVTSDPPFCTLTFSTPWAHGAPDCIAGGPLNMSEFVVATPTQVEFHNGDQPGGPSGNLLPGDVITYICLGH